MKRIIHVIAFSLLLGALSPASAQAQFRRGNPPDVDERIERHLQRLDQHLDLSEAQEDAIVALLEEHHEARKEWLAEHAGATREERRAEMQAQRNVLHQDIIGVLDARQRELFADFGQWRGPRFGQGGRGAPGPQGLLMLSDHLELTEEQRQELRELFQEHREEMRALRAERVASRADIEALRDDHRETVASILTSDQLQKLETFRTRRGGGPWHRRGGRRGAGADAPDLTEAQREQLRALRTDHRSQLQAWREANPEATREQWRAYRAEMRAEMREQVEAVLTPEQLQKLRRHRAEWQHPRRQWSNADESSATDVRRDALSVETYPNPFNPSTRIQFVLPEASDVSLIVYDAQGREVARLVDSRLGAGAHAATFDAAGLPSGTYLYRLTAGTAVTTGQLILTK